MDHTLFVRRAYISEKLGIRISHRLEVIPGLLSFQLLTDVKGYPKTSDVDVGSKASVS